jgi:hypothetical protein
VLSALHARTDDRQEHLNNRHGIIMSRYDVYNQYELFIYLDLMVKNREVPIERYFKWWNSIKLLWIR